MIELFTKAGHKAVLSQEDKCLTSLVWHSSVVGNNRYFKRNAPKGVRGSVMLHRIIAERMGLDVSNGALVDHINGDSADNRRENLRVVTRAQNALNVARPPRTNTSGYLGVSFDRSRGRWESYVWLDNVKKHLGRYDTAEAANAARLKAEAEFHGVQPLREKAHAA